MKLFRREGWPGWSLRLEFKLQDCWIGAYWKSSSYFDECAGQINDFDLWVCVLPCFPIHFTAWW